MIASRAGQPARAANLASGARRFKLGAKTAQGATRAAESPPLSQ